MFTASKKPHHVSWDPEGRHHYSKMFRWEPEGRYRHRHCIATAPVWLSTEHLSFNVDSALLALNWRYVHCVQKATSEDDVCLSFSASQYNVLTADDLLFKGAKGMFIDSLNGVNSCNSLTHFHYQIWIQIIILGGCYLCMPACCCGCVPGDDTERHQAAGGHAFRTEIPTVGATISVTWLGS